MRWARGLGLDAQALQGTGTGRGEVGEAAWGAEKKRQAM